VPARKTALVTGATAGIGAAFARRLAREAYDLVVVARDEQRLAAVAEELRTAHGVVVESIAADLATEDGRERVASRIELARGAERSEAPQLASGSLGQEQAPTPIDLLVNNAGLSLNTPFLRSTAAKEALLLSVNVHAVMRLTLAALPQMVHRRHGAVVNVSSVSGFGAAMPGSTYPASKAWVTNFSESVGMSVAPFGVSVMALCPGYVRTEFHQRAGIDMTKTPNWLWMDADDVVAAALRDVRRGKLVSVPSAKYKVAAFGLRHLPRPLLARVARDTRGRIGRNDPSV
jgi:short-subunit dehydrogenase